MTAILFAIVPILMAADSSLNQTMKAVESHYNRAQTLQVHFSETYVVQGRGRKTESGQLFLRKPGKMRWEYESPAGKLFVSDGKEIYYYNPDAKRVEKMKLKEAEDMRAPLAFLLGRLDFNKEFRDIKAQQQGENTLLTAQPKSDKLPYNQVAFLVTPQFQILKLSVTGQDLSVIDYLFADEKINPSLNGAMFQFKVPPGVELVDAPTQH